MADVLLSSVFKPFGVDGLYSRRDSKIELYHNQLTKYQGVFSIRRHMLSYGLHAIANNIEAKTTVLEFPTLERFRREVKQGYDYVGIGSIGPNFEKVKRMTREIRELSPRSKIVIGGFCATIEDIRDMLDVDYVCVVEGISFMRELLGQDPEFEFNCPRVFSEVREMHAFKQPWFKHPTFNLREAEDLQEACYMRDYYELGPSTMRWSETDLTGYMYMKDSENPNLRRRSQALEESVSLGRAAFGKFREWRTGQFGDAIQPFTRVFHYK